MDERAKELNELVGYGNRLLDEMSAKDENTVTMLRGVITHIHGIAQEYANDTALWRGKYEASQNASKNREEKLREQSANAENQAMAEVRTSLKKLKKAVKKIGKNRHDR